MVDTRHTSIVNKIYKATNITGGATLCERGKNHGVNMVNSRSRRGKYPFWGHTIIPILKSTPWPNSLACLKQETIGGTLQELPIFPQ